MGKGSKGWFRDSPGHSDAASKGWKGRSGNKSFKPKTTGLLGIFQSSSSGKSAARTNNEVEVSLKANPNAMDLDEGNSTSLFEDYEKKNSSYVDKHDPKTYIPFGDLPEDFDDLPEERQGKILQRLARKD